MTICARTIHWHAEGFTTVCRLPWGHQPANEQCDGLWWFDNNGQRLPLSTRNAGWQHDHDSCRSRAEHGTTAGHAHHRFHHERTCCECAQAAAEYQTRPRRDALILAAGGAR